VILRPIENVYYEDVPFMVSAYQISTTANEKALSETQTLRAGYSKTYPKKFAPPQTPFPGAWDGQNLISWRKSLPLPTNPVE